MKRNQSNNLKTKTIEIHARAQGLQKQIPAHLKMMPEMRQTIALINDMSEVLLHLAQKQKIENKDEIKKASERQT